MSKVILTMTWLTTLLLSSTVVMKSCAFPSLSYNANIGAIKRITSELPNMHTRVEFVISAKEKLNYPVITRSFTEAVTEWSKYLPIEVAIYTTPNGRINRDGVIRVEFSNIDGKYNSLDNSGGILGRWQAGKTRRLQLDSEDLNGKPETARKVALHELGHVFGLPHILNKGDDQAHTGDIMLADDAIPSSYLMYPSVSMNQHGVSELEIDRARTYIQTRLGLIDGAVTRECECRVDS